MLLLKLSNHHIIIIIIIRNYNKVVFRRIKIKGCKTTKTITKTKVKIDVFA